MVEDSETLHPARRNAHVSQSDAPLMFDVVFPAAKAPLTPGEDHAAAAAWTGRSWIHWFGRFSRFVRRRRCEQLPYASYSSPRIPASWSAAIKKEARR